MPISFDEKKWKELLKRPDWYLHIEPDYGKEEILAFFEKRLADGKVFLAPGGPDQDAERVPVDTIVIHHTKLSPGVTWQRLSALQLLRLYASFYREPYYERSMHLKGKPIYSGHFRPNGRQIFYAYHWLVREDGKAERLLADKEIGWQAGNWEMNKRSIAICLDGDFEHKTPPKAMIDTAARLIKENYPHISPKGIIGHRETNPRTACPGENFLNGWKADLLRMVAESV